MIKPRPWHASAIALAQQRPPLTNRQMADALGVSFNQMRAFMRKASPEGDRRAIVTPKPLAHQRPDHLFRDPSRDGLAKMYRKAGTPPPPRKAA